MKFPYLIAEIGSCFNTFKDCLNAIEVCADLGLSAVKFQYATWETMFNQKHPSDEAYEFDKNFIDFQWIPELSKKAHMVGLDFICSVFNEDHFKDIYSYVDYYKIASIEADDLNFACKVSTFDKTPIISVGSLIIGQIDRIDYYFKKRPRVYLHSVVKYPAVDPKLPNFRYLKDRYCGLETGVGISDHMGGVYHLVGDPVLLQSIDVLEIHFNPFQIKNKPDTRHSIDTMQMKELADAYLWKNDSIDYDVDGQNELAYKCKRVYDSKTGKTYRTFN